MDHLIDPILLRLGSSSGQNQAELAPILNTTSTFSSLSPPAVFGVLPSATTTPQFTGIKLRHQTSNMVAKSTALAHTTRENSPSAQCQSYARPGPRNSSAGLISHLKTSKIVDGRKRHNKPEAGIEVELLRIHRAAVTRRCRERALAREMAKAAGALPEGDNRSVRGTVGVEPSGKNKRTVEEGCAEAEVKGVAKRVKRK